MAADSLVARRLAMPKGGWAWRSSIQSPHYQTDRDVGAAGIGEGLLAAHAVTGDPRYRRAAVEAGDYLLGVAEPAAGGLRWPDWADADGHRSMTHFTSFDDGAAGISDYLWRLFEVTHEPRFRAGALAGMRWLVAQAEGRSARRRPARGEGRRSVLARRLLRGRHGPGGHRARPGHLCRPHRRLQLPSLRARRGRPARALTANGPRPLPGGDDASGRTLDTGFLSGSAGAAHMFLERYRRDRDPADLAAARGYSLGQRTGRGGRAGGVSWPFARHEGGGPRQASSWASPGRLGQPSGCSNNRRPRVPQACAPGRKLAEARRPPRWSLGRAARRFRLRSARRARQRRRRDRLGARGVARAGIDRAANRAGARSALAAPRRGSA